MANYFPRWTNILPLKIAVCVAALAVGAVAAFTYYGTPKKHRVGYQPDQPIPYDHELHVNQLGMDCRHCHSHVESSGQANIPTADVCARCHSFVKTDSPRLTPLWAALKEGKPIKWVKVHNAPDYVYFDHSAHVGRGISCIECHGEVNKMRVVFHAKDHSMGMCIECHRSPEDALRPLEEVYNLDYDPVQYIKQNPEFAKSIQNFASEHNLDLNPLSTDKYEAQKAIGTMLKHNWNIQPKESCFTCHR